MPAPNFVTVNGLRLEHYSSGSGVPVIFLHGVTRRWNTFLTLIPSLAQRWAIRAYSHRGHGHSDRAVDGYRVIDYTRDAVAYLRQHVDGPAIVYGHSLGSMVAAQAAAEAPDKVMALILEDPPFDTMGSRIKETNYLPYFTELAGILAPSVTVPEMCRRFGRVKQYQALDDRWLMVAEARDANSIRFSAKGLTQLDPEVLRPVNAGEWLDGYDKHAILAGIRCPTLLLQGDWPYGGMLSDEDARLARELVADLTLVAIPKAGHMLHWMNTAEVQRHLISFLESLE